MTTLQTAFNTILYNNCTSDKLYLEKTATAVNSEYLQVVFIKSIDFTFLEVPDTVSAGLTPFGFENEGMYPHDAGLVHISNGYAYEELIQYMGKYPG